MKTVMFTIRSNPDTDTHTFEYRTEEVVPGNSGTVGGTFRDETIAVGFAHLVFRNLQLALENKDATVTTR